MKTPIDRTAPTSEMAKAASPAMAQLLRLSSKAGLGHVVFSSLGAGRDRVVEHLLESLGDDRPSLLFGQALWPPSERPTKFRADITSAVKSKGDLFSRLAQATPQATLIAASDCGLPLFDLVETSVRAGAQLIYLAWVPQGDALERAPREIASIPPESHRGSPSHPVLRSQFATMFEAIPTALPVWVGLHHAPDGSFCVRTIAESRVVGIASDAGGVQCEIALDEILGFRSEGLSDSRAFEGQFYSTSFVPTFAARLAALGEMSADVLAAEVFRAPDEKGVSSFALPMSGTDSPRARRFRAPERPFDATKRA